MRHVLIVDDDDAIRRIATLTLERVGGWKVTGAASGADAIGCLRAPGAKFDAILLDVMMPGLDGPATLARLRAEGVGESVPVIFLTAKVQATDRKQLLALGVAGMIPKPFDPMALPSQIERTIAAAEAEGS